MSATAHHAEGHESARRRFGLASVRVRGFRSALDVTLEPGPLCALVGEANAGKSNLLLAIRALLDPLAAALAREDASPAGATIAITAQLADGRELGLQTTPPQAPTRTGGPAPAVAFLPGELRSGRLLAGGRAQAGAALERFEAVLAEQLCGGGAGSSTASAASLVGALESWASSGQHGLVLLIEEPELYLRPQAQRYLYRLLRRVAECGNQVIYSTHSPSFLNVARLDELALVQRAGGATTVTQPRAISSDEDFRVLTEFDAERSELFLARAALLVEGQTEKLAFPFVFSALGHDLDREGISIVACGGKGNLPLFARVCRATGVPFVAVFDRDAPPGRRPAYSARRLNSVITQLAGADHVVVLAPDFESAAGLVGHHHKPERAWRALRARRPDELPPLLIEAVRRVLALARDG